MFTIIMTIDRVGPEICVANIWQASEIWPWVLAFDWDYDQREYKQNFLWYNDVHFWVQNHHLRSSYLSNITAPIHK